jgi:hypothetical protein
VIQEIFIAILKAGLPVALTSYGLVWWALKNDYLDSVESLKDVEAGMKRRSREKSENKKKNRRSRKISGPEQNEDLSSGVKPAMNPVHNKWLAFGGGFYGVVSLLTYVVVELAEIRDFLAGFEGFADLISSLSIGLLIGVVFDAFTNFIVAIAWPLYWMSEIAGPYIWVWFAVAYLGYWTGAKYALRHAAAQNENGGKQ